jgi:hypothetical protein
MRYELLKREFRASAEAFAKKYSSRSLRLQVIATLARAKNDGGWPLEILEVLMPELARGLRSWTGRGYQSIRGAQELGYFAPGSATDLLQRNLSELPLWRGKAAHLSKSLGFFDRVRNDRTLALRSFMSCSAPPYTTAYVDGPDVITLRFTKLLTARLVGALSTENLEREVLLPAGSRFSVVRADKGRVLILHEMQPQVASETMRQTG